MAFGVCLAASSSFDDPRGTNLHSLSWKRMGKHLCFHEAKKIEGRCVGSFLASGCPPRINMSSGTLVCVPVNGCPPLFCEESVAKFWCLGNVFGILDA